MGDSGSNAAGARGKSALVVSDGCIRGGLMNCMKKWRRGSLVLGGSPLRLVLGVLLASTVLYGCKKDDAQGNAPADGKGSASSGSTESMEVDAESRIDSDDSVEGKTKPPKSETATSLPSPPESFVIPDIALDGYEPVVRDQLSAAIEAAKTAPKSADAVGKLGMLLDSYSQRSEACKLYQIAFALDSSNFNWAYLGGRMLFFEGDGEKAVEFLTRAAELDPEDLPCQVALINALMKVDRLQDAGERAAKLVEEHPKHPLANYLLGSINLKLKAPVFAMEYLKPVFHQFPDMGGVRRDVAATFDLLGQKEKAEAIRSVDVGNNRIPSIEDPHHEAVLQMAIGTNVENERGAYALMRGDAESAKTHFSNALRLSPGNVSARVGLADSLLRLGEFDGCEGMLRPLVKGEVESIAGTVLMAKLRIAQSRFDEVESLIEKAMELGAEPLHVLKLRFSLAEAKKDLPMIVGILEELVANDPGSADKHTELGYVYVLSKRLDDAEKQYLKALELDPRHAGAMQGLGALYTLSGEVDAARTWYLKAFEAGGAAARTLLLAGQDTLDRGDYARGLAILGKAYAMYPKDRDLGDTLSRTYSMCPEPTVRDWEKAMRIAVEIYGDDEDAMPFAGLHTLAAAHAEADNYDEAARLMEVGVKRASEIGDNDSILRFNKSKRQYAGGKHLYDPLVIPSEYE